MRVVYMGTPDFAVPALEALAAGGCDVRLAITKPDAPSGRGKKLKSCPVKEKALELGIPVLSPERVKKNDEFFEAVKAAEPDIIIVAAYGKILPKRILDIPRLGCVNIHGSLLPKYRGAAPIQRAVLAGEEEIGVTLMYMAEEMDAGDMIAKASVKAAGKTSAQVFGELSELGAKLLMETLPAIEDGTAPRIPQDPALVSFAPMVEKSEGLIDFGRSAREIVCHVLGMNSWPMAYTFLNGEMMKVHEAEAGRSFGQDAGQAAEEGAGSAQHAGRPAPGTVLAAGKRGIEVACGDGSVLLKKIQMPGKKAMDVSAWLLGNKIEIGTVLG